MTEFLSKKGHSDGMSQESHFSTSQVANSKKPTHGVSHTQEQNHANTKSTGGAKPTGKPHAKVVGSSPTQVGKYL